MKKTLAVLCVLLFALLAVSCSVRDGVPLSAVNEASARVLRAATEGVLGPRQPLRVEFHQPMVEPGLVGSSLTTEAWTLEPPAAGSLVWTETSVLEYKGELEAGRDYRLTLRLGLLKPGIEGLQDVSLSVRRLALQVVDCSVDVLNEPGMAQDTVSLGGQLRFNMVPSEEPGSLVHLAVAGRELPLRFSRQGNDALFRFASAELLRTDKEQPWVLKVRQAPDRVREYSGSIPPAKVMQALSAQAVSRDDSAHLRVHFSDPLDPFQVLDGLVTVEGVRDYRAQVREQDIILLGAFEPGRSYKVLVRQGIRSRAGEATTADRSFQPAVTDQSPGIEFLSGGVYLPSSMNRKIRFKTMNLSRATLKITRVFESNFGQYLQTERLSVRANTRWRYEDEYGDNLQRVGLTVHQAELDLGSRKNEWLQHELDLSKILPPGDRSLLYITLTYNKDWELAPSELEYWDTYSRSVIKPVVQSDLGLTVKMIGKEAVAFVTDLLQAKPLAGVTVKLMTYQNQLIAEAKTGADGLARFSTTGVTFYVLAERGDQRSAIRLNEMAWNTSSFDTEGREINPDGQRAYIFTERGVYRPGDPIHLSMIARNGQQGLPDNFPVSLKFYNPRNQLVSTLTNTTAKDGFYSFDLATAPQDPTGTWRAVLDLGARQYEHPVQVETVVPNRIKVLMNLPRTNWAVSDNAIPLELESRYLFGNPAAGLEYELSVRLSALAKSFSAFPGYTFGNETRIISSELRQLDQGSLDGAGKSAIDISMDSLLGESRIFPSALTAELIAVVKERGGRAVRNSTQLTIDPYPSYVGLQKPELEFGVARIGQGLQVNTVLVDRNGKALAGKKLSWKLYRSTQYWWWEYDDRNEFLMRFKSNPHVVVVAEGSLNSGNTPVSIKLDPKEWGTHFLEVTAQGSDHAAGFFFYASHWWGGSDSGEDGADLLNLVPDKTEYKPGDTARIRVPFGDTGGALVMVESGVKLLSSAWVPTTRGPGGMQTIEVPITREMVPTAYVNISVIQEHAQTANDRPLRMYGIVPLKVADVSFHQDIQITVPDELAPKKPFTVQIQTADRQPTQLVVAVVDEGLLDLTRHKTPDARSEFLAKLRMMGRTWDLFSQVINAHKGDAFRVFSIGGDDYDQGEFGADKEKSRFPPVALFQGPIMTDASGRASVDFVMPDYIGSVRVMVTTARGSRYGSAERAVPVRTDLVALPNIPRVLGPSDVFLMPVTVFAMKEGLQKATVQVNVTGPLKIEGTASREVTFPASRETDALFFVRAKPAVGTGTITIKVSSGASVFETTVNLPVRASSPRIYKQQDFQMNAGASISYTIPKDGLEGSNSTTISLSRIPGFEVTHRLEWLIQYPYGCIEQTTSSVFPQLFLQKFIRNRDRDAGSIDRNINAGISRLRSFQTASGGFSYWPGETEVSTWGSNYAGHFLVEAKLRGYAVPEAMLKAWIAYQTSAAAANPEDLQTQTYRLYLLALAGEPNLGAMNYLMANKLGEMSGVQKAMLAGAYKLGGMTQESTKLSAAVGLEVAPYKMTGGHYGSALRDRAILLEIMILLEKKAEAFKLFQTIMKDVSSTNWYSTQELGYSLLSAGKYLQYLEKISTAGKNMSGKIVLPNGQEVPFNTPELRFSHVLSEYPGQQIKVILDSGTVAPLFVSFAWNGVPLKPVEEDISKNLSLGVEYFLESDGGFLSVYPHNVAQGRTLWVRLTAVRKTDQRLDELALTYLLPAGWEIENPRMSGEQVPEMLRVGEASTGYEYMDIRDDRVSWFFDSEGYNRAHVFYIKVRAVSKGNYIMPPPVFEAMYDRDYYAVGSSATVTVGTTDKLEQEGQRLGK